MAGRPGASAQRPDSARPESARQQLDLVFDNNRLASALYGEFDQNLALIEGGSASTPAPAATW
jgi:hypothetical protein